MEILRFVFEQLCLIFFISHIPITILVDSQAIIPREHFPLFARNMLDDFLRDFKDPLMTPPLEIWFKSFIYSELVFQFPMFFVGVYAFAKRSNAPWIRILLIMYGSFVVATMVPILTVLATHREEGYNPYACVGFYAPYMIFPAAVALFMAHSDTPFTSSTLTKNPSKLKDR